MNLIFALNITKSSQHIAWRISRSIIITLCVSFLTAVPALADTVRINQVQTLTTPQGTAGIRLNTLAQDPIAPGTKGSTKQNGPRADAQASGSQPKTDSIISGVTVASEQQIGVDIVEEGEVEGTICDCGEVFVAGAAFPKWPFLFLGAVPLVFISECDDCDEPPSSTPTPTPTPPSTPTPTPTPPEIPEPASLLLFGTGLVAFGAGLRRRYTKSKIGAQVKGQEEE
jgi:hypothetical protein